MLSYSLLVGCGFLFAAQEKTGSELSKFERLDSKERELFLVHIFEKRLEHSRNVYYESTQIMRRHHFKNGTVGETLSNGLKFKFQNWRHGDSWLMETQTYGKPTNVSPSAIYRTGYDADSNISNGTRSHNGNTATEEWFEKSVGVISLNNRYENWFDGKDENVRSYIFRGLVNARDGYQVTILETGFVELVIPWKRHFKGPVGSWTYLLDPTKGFMPVHGIGKWSLKRQDGREIWRIKEFAVEQSKKAGNIWMPTEIYETLRSDALGDDEIMVFIIGVAKIENGGVTSDDVKLEIDKKNAAERKTRR